MRRRLFVVVALLLSIAPIPALAALPPYYQSLAEMQRILGDERLAELMSEQGAIRSIEHNGRDGYVVRGDICLVEVQIVDVPRAEGSPVMLGPRQFDLKFGELFCQ